MHYIAKQNLHASLKQQLAYMLWGKKGRRGKARAVRKENRIDQKASIQKGALSDANEG
jgi:hypothetical protein